LVLPGPTASEGVGIMLDAVAERQGRSREDVQAAFLAEARPTSLLGRLTQPDEVAAMILYVCSPLASGTAGAALRVVGGVVRSIV
jgi:NAD(P)-dependent dehydrogenase (short-subunit alcohol dehydrogenase family)